MAFDHAQLLSQLTLLPTGGCVYMAYSGGLDSSVLLHAMAHLRLESERGICAIHADHGLQDDSARWSEHCGRQCVKMGIRLHKVHLNLKIPPGESPEAVARTARYAAFSELLDAGDLLLTAHHADDQVETVLLQLLRGAGVSGLAGMPMIKRWHRGWLVRPLLGFSRLELQQYAVDNGLQWMEDGSNQDERFSRNLLRRRITPELKNRWPGLLKTISRSAKHCASAASLVNELAEIDLRSCQGSSTWRLSMDELKKLSSTRQENLLRYWIRRCGMDLPNTHGIRRILSEVLTADEMSHPLVTWPGAELRRYAGEIYIMLPLPSPERDWLTTWDGSSPLKLPGGLGELRIHKEKLSIPEKTWRTGRVQVGFRRRGLKCTPAGRSGSRSFKRLCQDLNIPAWLRPLVPLLLVDGELAAMAGYCVCEPYAGQAANVVKWSRPAYLS